MFAVDWQASASRDFAEIAMIHVDRWADINAADRDIDRALRRDPLQRSTPIAEGLRRIDSAPLAIYFSGESNSVIVEAVAWIG